MSPRSDLLADLLAFHVRLWLAGLFLAVLVPVSVIAAFLNLIQGVGPNGGPYAAVHANAVAFETWLRDFGRSRETMPKPSAGSMPSSREQVRL